MHFLALESQLIERLRARLPQQIHVLSAAALADVMGGKQPAPAVMVLYGGYQPLEAEGRASVLFEQTWQTVVVTRSHGTLASGFDARTAGGEIASQVIAALAGWKPEAASSFLKLDRAASPDYDSGWLYLPLAWRARRRIIQPCEEPL